MFGGNFAPAGWAFCDGQLMPISENETLFNLIGTTYGGDGQETFALPDLQGRVPIHAGQGPAASPIHLAETGGVETVTLTVDQIPVHTHALLGSPTIAGNATAPGRTICWRRPRAIRPISRQPGACSSTRERVQPVGGSQPHDNMLPYPLRQTSSFRCSASSRRQT